MHAKYTVVLLLRRTSKKVYWWKLYTDNLLMTGTKSQTVRHCELLSPRYTGDNLEIVFFRYVLLCNVFTPTRKALDF